MNKVVLAGFALAVFASVAHADQSRRPKPNGLVTFKVSTQNATRLRFTNDRVVEIITDSSAFERRNDEASGDVYFRLIEGAEASVERGYVITEKGITIRYQLTPVRQPVEDVVIEVRGLPDAENTSTPSLSTSNNSRVVPGGSGYKNGLIQAIRETITTELRKRPRSSGRVKTIKSNGYTIELHGVSGGKSGRRISEADFAKPGVLAVWAEHEVLSAGQRAWLLVVRK